MDKKRTVEKNRERIEIRTAYTSDDAAWLCGREKWKNPCCIGAIRKEVEADGKRTEEWHYYISSRRLSAEELLHHARMEWAVESMHWLLDVHYGEDYCRIANKAAQVIQIVREPPKRKRPLAPRRTPMSARVRREHAKHPRKGLHLPREIFVTLPVPVQKHKRKARAALFII